MSEPTVASVARGLTEALSKSTTSTSRVRVSTDESDRVAYARDLWPRHLVGLREGRAPGERPQAIAWPESTEQVASLVRWCAQEGVPIVPYGAGSGVCGGILPDARTVVVDLKRMKNWRKLDRDAPTLDVEAGAMGITLEEDLQRDGFTIGHFPSSILCSTVGGWIAARGAGQASGRYGKIEDMVVDLEMVDGRGDVAKLSRRFGSPDLLPLVIGSEGTLGVITSATMRLHPAPATRGFASFAFRSTEAGWEAMRLLFQHGLRPAVARLYDPFDAAIARMGGVKSPAQGQAKSQSKVRTVGAGGKALQAILRAPRALNGLIEALERVPASGKFRAMLVLVFEGDATHTRDGVDAARALITASGGEDLGEGPAQRWLTHRYAVSYRQPPTIRTGAFLDTMEVAAPWSKLGGLYHDVRKALGKHVFVMAHLSHAYPDGCSIYFTFAGAAGKVGDGGKSTEETYDRAWRDALDAAIGAGGTASHHHGVGRSKAPRLGQELGVGVDVVRLLKAAFDPGKIFNLGNLLPDSPRHPGASESAIPTRLEIDETSLLAQAPATTKLSTIEDAARTLGLTLGLDSGSHSGSHSGSGGVLEMTVGAYVDAGYPGSFDRWVDPVDHPLAGLVARLRDGRILVVRPGPRRAVGPDLVALVAGARGRFLTTLGAHLRLYKLGGLTPATAPLRLEREPPTSAGEKLLLDAIEHALHAG